MGRSSFHWLAVTAAISSLVLAACAPKAAPAPTAAPSPSAPATAPAPSPRPGGEWDKVLAAAKKEGSLTVFSTSANQLVEAAKDEMAKYGIKLETVGGSGGELELKIQTEQRAKAYTADLLMSGWTNVVSMAEAGQGQPVAVALPSLAEKGVWKVEPDKYDPAKTVFVYGTGLTPSLIINTDLVRPSDVQSWQDLLDPKWRDKIVMTDGRGGSGPGAGGLWAAKVQLGEDYWKKFAAQRPFLTANAELPVQQVSYGERPIAIFPNFLRVVRAAKAGAPIKIIHLKEGTQYYVAGIGFVKNAPHPNASLVLLNWLFTREGQIATAKATGLYTIRKDISETWLGIPELNPSSFVLLEPPNNLDVQSSAKGAEFGKSIFGAR